MKNIYFPCNHENEFVPFWFLNGNEAGAYPKEWVAGGETKNGTKEAALIGSEKINHGADMNKLLSQFNGWEQLQ